MNSTLRAEIDAHVGSRVPGIAVVVVAADEIMLSDAWGLADVATRAEMRVDTSCNWFSMTKLVTATVAMQLAEQGRLDLDAPVDEPFSVTRTEPRRRSVTVRHLLSHSSGLANPLPLRWVHLADEPGPTRSQFVRDLIEKHPRLRFDPGTKAAYSNIGYLVVGEAIAAVTGHTYEACVG